VRQSEITRTTGETDITIFLNLDGCGKALLDYPIGFMKHMLNTFAKHGLFDLDIKAKGDLVTDQHHLVEDTGIVLGQCFAQALGNRRGIVRCGSCLYPMDETLAQAAVDISGRAFLEFDAQLSGVPLVSQAYGGVGKAGDVGGATASTADATPIEGTHSAAKMPQDLFQTDTVEDFWRGFASAAGLTLHLNILRGRSDHHKIEALFKAASRALRQACEIEQRAAEFIPSTKGVIA
jgi:imidazoleglycerol-phosphate dehydratase